MATFYPNSSQGENKNGGFIVGNSQNPGNTTFTNIKLDNVDPDDRRATPNQFIHTISQTSPQSVLSVYDCSGYMGFTLSGYDNLSVGDVFCVSGAYPLIGCYQIESIDGSGICTTTSYMDCVSLSGGETWTTSSGLLDPVAQAEYRRADDVCRTPNVISRTNNRATSTVYSHVYTSCWECFTGTVDPCDNSGTVITLWDDQISDNIYWKEACDEVIEGNVSEGSHANVGVDNDQS